MTEAKVEIIKLNINRILFNFTIFILSMWQSFSIKSFSDNRDFEKNMQVEEKQVKVEAAADNVQLKAQYEFPAKKLALRLREIDVESIKYWKIPLAIIGIISEYALHLHTVCGIGYNYHRRRTQGPTILLNLSNLSNLLVDTERSESGE